VQNKDNGADLYFYLPKDDVNSEPIVTLAETTNRGLSQQGIPDRRDRIHRARDTLDSWRLVVCDVNFLTGKGLRNSTPIAAMLKPIKTESFNSI
jgi:hypothetical protein